MFLLVSDAKKAAFEKFSTYHWGNYMIQMIAKKIFTFVRKEFVLSIAIILALLSSILVPPSNAYISYIDWDTLALLFSMMAIMKGLQKSGLFDKLGNSLLKTASTSRKMLLILVFLPFFFSMIITNDISLLTFVPFGIIVLRMADLERLLIPLVVLQTAAANLGSMLTPMGNPQNLYLYTKSGVDFIEFCGLMFPYVFLSGICLLLFVIFQKKVPIHEISVHTSPVNLRDCTCYLFGFALCLLAICKLISPFVIAVVLLIFLLFVDRDLLTSVDYSLLGTFIAFFIFVGNMANIEPFKNFFLSILSGREMIVSVLASQVISNVPAALLMSDFTTQWSDLIIGCNLGGLGTLIASMASLISYKMLAKEYPQKRVRYFLYFTVTNILLLAILLLGNYFLSFF